MLDLLPVVVDHLAADRSVALAMVVGRRGSLPMARCAKMLMLDDGSTRGTVGGGCLEAEVWSVGRELLRQGGCSLDTFHLNEVEEGLGGHVCGGTVSILTRVLRPMPPTRELVTALHATLAGERSSALVTRLPESEGRAPDGGWALLESGGDTRTDGLRLDAPTQERCRGLLAGKAPVELGEPARLFVEPLHPTPVVSVFGAGHCGKAIGRVAAGAGFRVRLYDDREPFLEAAASPWAEHRECIDFARASEAVRVAPHHYLVIVTRGHEHDLELMRQLASTPAAYMGMIGSQRKRLLFERTLAAEGVPRERLERLRSPMGLPIGADTPEEIAVAVVGEMIAVRRGAGGAR